MIRRWGFAAMGTDVELLLDSDSDADSGEGLLAAEHEIRRLERLLSRFDPESELSMLNRAGSVVAGPELAEVTELALMGRESTGGRFDPTVHDAVVASGYDRSFDLMGDDVPRPAGIPAPGCGGGVHLDRETGAITLSPGARLDLGGIAKGYAADRVSVMLSGYGPCLVNVGGDLATCGVPGEGAWAVGVAAPEGDLCLSLERGAMATSGRDRRRWRCDGEAAHHVIDPSTARPVDTDLLRVTVVAASAAWAEVLATGFLVSGAEAAEQEAHALGVPCLLVTDDGTSIRAGGLA